MISRMMLNKPYSVFECCENGMSSEQANVPKLYNKIKGRS